MTQEELEDLIAEAIDDSMDMDWTSRDGARAVAEALVFEYLQQCAEGALKSNNPEITHDCNELVHILEAITAMQALRYGDATRTHMALIGLCVTARATLATHQANRSAALEPRT